MTRRSTAAALVTSLALIVTTVAVDGQARSALDRVAQIRVARAPTPRFLQGD